MTGEPAPVAPDDRLRFGIIGLGRIGRRLATRLSGDAEAPNLAAVLVRPEQRETAYALVGAARVCTSIHEFLERRLRVAAECASAASLGAHGPALLAAGIDVIPLSLGAFADEAVEASLLQAARAGPGRMELPAGAMGSLGFLAAAREDGLSRVRFRAAYPVARWRRMGAAARLLDLDRVAEPVVFFKGTVREVLRAFPGHLNVAAGVALAGLGLDHTEAELVADPRLSQATFEVEASAAPGAITLRVGGRDAPVEADPIDYTTFSVIRLLRRRQAFLKV
jgi:aspartate dehydrogenase